MYVDFSCLTVVVCVNRFMENPSFHLEKARRRDKRYLMELKRLPCTLNDDPSPPFLGV
jgi:hypothetical protein